ncbi:MAG: prenyltransferase/squalene oxidase repeat-containing protein, partial [Ardenticatenales bacterium]
MLAVAIALASITLGAAVRRAPSLSHAQPASPPATADVVIDYDDGRVAIARAPIGAGLTGEALLRGAGFDARIDGGAVCRIAGVGCPSGECFCGNTYWAYYGQTPDGRWAYATTGPSQRTLAAGDVDAWVWRGARAPITATAQQRAVWLGARWLREQQAPNGDYASPGLAVEAILAARAAGEDPTQWTMGGRSVVGYLVKNLDAYSQESAAQAGKGLVGVAAAGQNIDDVGGFHPVDNLARYYDPATGRYGPSTWEQSWAMLGVAAATNGQPQETRARSALIDGAAPSGGWSSMLSDPNAEIDSTGLAIQALVAAGEPITSTAITAAIAYLDDAQRVDGGWGHDAGHETSNANSTAYALQALYAVGEAPRGPRWTSSDGQTGIDYLMALQRADGAVESDASGTGNPLIASGQAVPALSGRSLIVPGGRAVGANRAMDWLVQQRSADGGFAGGAANPGATIDALLAVSTSGTWQDGPGLGGQAMVRDYLAAQAANYAAVGPSAAGKLLAAISTLRAIPDRFHIPAADPHDFGGIDVVAALMASYDPATGAFGAGGTWDQAWPILGLKAINSDVPVSAVLALREAASPAGGWGFDARAAEPDADSTGLALQALGAMRQTADNSTVAAGIAFLRRTQNATGGWPGYGPSDGASIDTTAAAVLGLVAVGQRVDRTGWYRPSAAHPLGLGPLDALV